THPRLKNALVVVVGLVLAALGTYNIFLKATWTIMDDGVFWKSSPAGIAAGRVAAGGPAALAGVRVGDLLLAVDGEEVASAQQVQQTLARRAPGARLGYSLLRAAERRSFEVVVQPLSQG